uniref:Uncharacterized protein n=1 Tax=Anopheles albimanus TaxID=7167 RepID=A0A182FYP1_ANOAL
MFQTHSFHLTKEHSMC